MNSQDPKTVPLRAESAPEPSEPVTALSSLRKLRLARGLSVEEVASRLKFAPRVIEALESERWADLPRGVGLKTLVKNYTKLLGVDTRALEPALREHWQTPGSGIAQHTSTRSIGGPMEETASSGSLAWIVLIVLVVVVVMGIALWQGLVPERFLPTWIKS